MLVIVPKWRVSVVVGAKEHTFWISDNYISNVLRQVAAMQFSENGLEHPSQIIIGEVVGAHPQAGVTYSTTSERPRSSRADGLLRTQAKTLREKKLLRSPAPEKEMR